MKTHTTALTVLLLIGLILASSASALQRKELKDVSGDQLTEDVQAAAPCGDDHMNLVWWIPHEFWQVTFANDPSISSADSDKILSALKPYSIIAVCQADISDFGAFRFYDKSQIANTFELSLTKEGAAAERIKPITDVDADVNVLLGMFTPILGAALGEMGKNLHFYVLSDVNSSGQRCIDPYSTCSLNVKLATRTGRTLNTAIEMPLNALYVPRKCPNGKDADVTWKYCPWTGEKLPD